MTNFDIAQGDVGGGSRRLTPLRPIVLCGAFRRLALLACAVSLASGVPAAQAQSDPSFVVDAPVGQMNKDSCQSYSLAIALAFKRDPMFPIASWSQLRAAEAAIRADIVGAQQARDPSGSVNWDDVAAGFSTYTSGGYVLNKTTMNITALGTLIGDRTGVTDASQVSASFVLGATVNDVVLSSATAIGGKTYGSGHIFTILGVDGPPNSSRRYLVLNSATKFGATPLVACTDSMPDDPGPYQASLGWLGSSDITFKDFGGGYAAWTIDKVP